MSLATRIVVALAASLSIAAGGPSKRLVALEDMPPEINKNTVTQSNFPRFIQLGFKLLF